MEAFSGSPAGGTYDIGDEALAAIPDLGRATAVDPHAGDEARATRALFERYASQIYAFCLHQLGSREEAEDAVQSTFLNAFRGLRRGVTPEAEAAWLFKIAHNVCLTRRRSSSRRGRVEAPGDLNALQDLVAAPQRVGTEELIQLEEALADMPEAQRKAILLREWQGLSYREIANELNTTQAAVETLIFRGRRSLAAGLERPPQSRARRLRHGMDVGSLLAALKGLLAGGAAVKTIATAAAVTTAAAVAVKPFEHARRPAWAAPASTPTAVVGGDGAESRIESRRGELARARPRASRLADARTSGAPARTPAGVAARTRARKPARLTRRRAVVDARAAAVRSRAAGRARPKKAKQAHERPTAVRKPDEATQPAEARGRPERVAAERADRATGGTRRKPEKVKVTERTPRERSVNLSRSLPKPKPTDRERPSAAAARKHEEPDRQAEPPVRAPSAERAAVTANEHAAAAKPEAEKLVAPASSGARAAPEKLKDE